MSVLFAEISIRRNDILILEESKRVVLCITISTMKSVLYRVETYIVPETDEISLEAAINKIDDIKLANRLKIKDENISQSNMQNEKNDSLISHIKRMESAEDELIGIKVMKDLTKQNKILLDRQSNDDKYNNGNSNNTNSCHSDERSCVQKLEFQTSIESQNALYPARQFKQINSLTSIDERSESSLDSKLTDFCRHGYKNGCTASIPPPEEVSEEVFKDNWFQKLDILRQRETVLREREMRLQSKERELFKREKEVRILERILKDKICQVDEQLKRQREIQVVEKRLEETARILNHELKEPETEVASAQVEKPNPIINDRHEKNEEFDQKIKRPIRSKNYSSKQSFSSNATSGIHTYASIKYKEQRADRKICYDDLNSTLSADPGDSSFVKTSELFNPELYKKPYAFTRSASERWTRQKANAIIARPQGIVGMPTKDVLEKSEHPIEENKVFQKLSENICASQNKDTRFQNYGLVDCKSDDVRCKSTMSNEGKSFSYLNLEIGDRHKQQRLSGVFRDRPVSWNEETDEWLQKKREEYNLAIKKSVENKENLKCNKSMAKGGKTAKKDVKSKLFTLFS